MGTLVIEEWAEVGNADQAGLPLYRGLCAVTNDTSTSTSDETITLSKKTRFISVLAVSGDHKCMVNSSTAENLYFYIKEGERRDVSAPAALGATVAYQTVA